MCRPAPAPAAAIRSASNGSSRRFPAALTIKSTGGLLLRIDPRLFFVGIDFSQLPVGTSTGGYVFSDDPTAADYFPTGEDLFSNLTSIGPYTFSWTNDL